jgi:ligand-binding sensor domain-containing protein/AraC-like DNA-binding protein/DNA-binding NarL/FixJ family response regulator
MCKSILKNLCLTLLLLLPLQASAAYLFKTLDAREGLTSSQITCIQKDSRGFMWFGTPAGLYRYDGYKFKHFQCDSQDGSSLPDSYILRLQESIDGSLWVETPSGYCVYHPQSESFERDMRQIYNKMGMPGVADIAYFDRYHNLWCYLPNRGIMCYNMQQQMIFEFNNNGSARGSYSIPQGEVCSIGECKDGAVIVYSDGQLVCCDVMHQQNVVWTTTEISQKQLRHSNTLRVFADQKDNIWLYGQGTLFIYNKKRKEWNTTIGNQLGLTGVNADFGVNSMAGDRNGNIWIATNRNGLVRVNVNTLAMEPIGITAMRPIRTKGVLAIQSIYVDDTDLLWVGTGKAGVAYWGENIYKFEAEIIGDITAMSEDANNHVVYGTSDDGIIGYDGKLASMKVTALTHTKDGSLWVGSKQNGLTRIKGGTVKIFSIANDSTRRTLVDDHINDLCTDKSGNLWIATDGGLQMYNINMETFSNYTKQNGKLRVNNVTSLHYGKDHKMLIGTSEGLTIMNISTTETKHIIGNTTGIKKFTNNYITYVFEDSRGLIWVGTREGINILNLENDELDILTEKQGLCNNNICGISEDKNHNVWITTSNGVSRIVIQRNHEDGTYGYGLYNYSQTDGLQSNEFNLGAILTKHDGNVLMGGLYGVNWARPKTADESESLPRVMLTELLIGEEEIQTGHSYNGHVPLPTTLNESNRIELLNIQNTFTIKFAAGNYNQSERLQFNYWMEGLDDDWRNGDALKHGVTFTNLKSGTYKLHVKAISAEGAVSNQERVIEIIIDRPWYLQWWMLLFYAVVIIITLYLWKIGIDQLRNIWKKKNALLEELSIQREEIKAASDDLRQPMARMTSIIMNLSEGESSLEEREQLNALHSQMLQVITRVSDMQMALEHPEENARQQVNKHFELNSRGEMNLPEAVSEELTSEIRSQYRESPTSKFRVMFIDDNDDFIKFVDARLRYVYDFHSYNNILNAAADVETTRPDLVICKHDMQPMTGSELCNKIKSSNSLNKIKFVLMTDGTLSGQEMQNQNISMSADDYLAKPFNLQEAAMRFNKVLGIGAIEVTSNLIEGAETRMLEGHNSSMTTATETMDYGSYNPLNDEDDPNDEMHAVEVQYVNWQKGDNAKEADEPEEFGEYSMNNAMDRQLINNIEQYVQQNMSRGQINLEEMAQAMGMAMRPFFQKVRNITGKTPAEVVRDMRLKHACILLKRTNINMSELAVNIGFATGEHFINIFKEKFGISPTEYRQKYRK